MGKVKFSIAMSLDGYAAGPNQSKQNPLGEGGEELHEWALALRSWREQHGREGGDEGPANQIVAEQTENVGAVLMGRNMFGGGPGPWDEDDPWRGWWGDEPPFHVPVFVLTHHPRERPEMEGGTTFTFVTDGIESALGQARSAAGEGKDIQIAGSANVCQQYIAAGLVDEIGVSIAPVFLGAGERLFDNLGSPPPKLEQDHVIAAELVTHVSYRVVKK
jgi:dihydrofolate reductase